MYCSIGFKMLIKRTTVNNFREYKSFSKPFGTYINCDYTLIRLLSNMTGATCGPGVAYPSVAPQLTLCNKYFMNQHRNLQLLFYCCGNSGEIRNDLFFLKLQNPSTMHNWTMRQFTSIFYRDS